MQVEALRQLQSEITTRAERMERALYSETAIQIVLTITGGIRFHELCKKRDKVRYKACAMWDVCRLIDKQINHYNENQSL